MPGPCSCAYFHGQGAGAAHTVPQAHRETSTTADRAEKNLDEEHVTAFMGVAPMSLQRALVLALEQGSARATCLCFLGAPSMHLD